MIPYLDSISNNDIQAYWGNGYILLQFDNRWYAYLLRRVDENTCTLQADQKLATKEDKNPRKVTMSREEFFAQALLHRPPLGVVVDPVTNTLVHMSWLATGGDRVKAMHPKDIHFVTLAEHKPSLPKPKPVPKTYAAHGKLFADAIELYQTRLETAAPTERIDPDNDPAFPADGYFESPRSAKPWSKATKYNVRKNSMKLVLKYLNTEHPSLEEACATARTHQSSPGPNGTWVKYNKEKDSCSVYSGKVLLGAVLGKDSRFLPATSKVVAKQKSVARLAKTLLSI